MGEGQNRGMRLSDTDCYLQNEQQRYIVQPREIKSLFCNNFKWSVIYKNIESLCCIPETNIVYLYFNKYIYL